MDVSENIGIALLLTALAGLSTGIGSTIAYFIKKPKMIYLSFSLGFSAGVMIYISFVELLPNGSEGVGEVGAVAAFFVGILFTGLIDMLIPQTTNPHDFKEPSEISGIHRDKGLMRAGLFTALAIGIHNLPEGLATFVTALSNAELGVIIAIAIAIHNIPEGISVSVPIFYATGDKKKAFIYSVLSGISEPVGAIVGFLILRPFLSEQLLAFLLAFIAGIMVYVSLDELLPIAHHYGESHAVILGISLGMLVMALSLLIL